jgi:hypothetical protein
MNANASKNISGELFEMETGRLSEPGSSASAATLAFSRTSKTATARERFAPIEETLPVAVSEPTATALALTKREVMPPIDLELQELTAPVRLTGLRENPKSEVRFVVLQEWEGLIDRITSDTIEGRLIDITGGGKEWSDFFSLPLEEISEFNQRRMRIGSIFRWVVGYQKHGETQRRFAEIVLRELPQWREADLRRAKDQGATLASRLRVLDGEEAAGT